MSRGLDLAERAVKAAQGDEADVSVHVESSGFARFAASAVHQPTLVDNAGVQLRVISGRRSGVAREAPALGTGVDLRFALGHERESALGQHQCGHAVTPTWTFRNRAGEAPWETCACWPGWPLPQFVKPYIVHSSGPATRSREPQKTGVIPV